MKKQYNRLDTQHNYIRHCEERSDVAIQNGEPCPGLLLSRWSLAMTMLILIAFVLTLSTTAQAELTAEEILNAGGTPEEVGLAIAVEADERDFGFGDMEVELDMVLRNARGQESNKHQRNKTFEVADHNLGDKTLIIFDKPRDVKGTAFLTYSKILDPDDQWLYLPALKRVKRISSKNKSGPFVGSEFAYEDISSQEVGKYTYKYIKNEPCPNHPDLQCFVQERYPQYEHSGYTKQIAWVDTQEFRLQVVDFYDRKDELLKTLTYEGYQQYLEQYWRPDIMKMLNHNNKKTTELHWNNYRFRTGIAEGDLTKEKLKLAK